MERKKNRRRVLWLIAAIVIGAIVVFALVPSRLLVEVGRVNTGPLQVTIDQEGETRAEDRFTVSAPVPGRLLRVDLKDGDAVKKDQVVARIDPLPLSQRERQEILARVEAAEAAERQAEARGRMPARIGRRPAAIGTAPSGLRAMASFRRRRWKWQETRTSRPPKNSTQPNTALKWPPRK